MAEMINYNKSPIPPEKPGGIAVNINPDRSIGVDDRGRMTYASAAAEGRVEIELPSLAGSPNPTERLHAADFGPIVLGKIESSMKQQPYLRSGATQGPVEVLKHFASAARGAKLLDDGSLDYMDRLAKEFGGARGEDRQKYLNTMVKPYLLSLTPQRRQK